MEIRLTILTENEIECVMNGTMQTNIRKNTSFNFKLYCIDCLLNGGRILDNQTHVTGAPLHTWSKLYNVPVGFVPPLFGGSVLL